jgi:hypothetical protein
MGTRIADQKECNYSAYFDCSTKGVILRYEGSAFAFCRIKNNSRSFVVTQDDIIVFFIHTEPLAVQEE